MAIPTDILCIGGAVLDRKFVLAGPLQAGTSNPATATRSFGGVARNVCENLAHLRVATALMTRIGDDAGGALILRDLEALGIDTRLVEYAQGQSTAEYVAVLNSDGALQMGLADMAIFDAEWPLAGIASAGAGYVFADCNLPASDLLRLITLTGELGVKLALDCVSVAKAGRIPPDMTGIDLLFANADEAAAVLGRSMSAREAAAALLSRGVARVVLTLGPQGAVLADCTSLLEMPALPAQVVDVTGAGDALVAATLAGLIRGSALADAVRLGLAAAAATLGSRASVRADLNDILGMDL